MTARLELPADVLDNILMCTADFKTLGAFMLAGKSIHNVFKDRPASIMAAVACNLLGSHDVLGPALRGVRAELHGCFDIDVDDVPEDAHEALEQELRSSEQDMHAAPLTWREARALDARARICNRIEVIYSATAKDRTTEDSSRLSPEESCALQKVLHRLWLVVDIARYFSDFAPVWGSLDQRRETFYDALSIQELWELNETWRFFANTCHEISSSADPQEFYHQYGLTGFVNAFDSDTFDFPSGEADVEFDLDDDFSHLWPSRNVTDWEQGAPKGYHCLLRSTVGSTDTCELTCLVLSIADQFTGCRCGGFGGVHLYNRTNWQYLRRLRDPAEHWMNLPGSLRYNRHETQMLLQYLRNDPAYRAHPSEPLWLGAILEALFDLPNVVTLARFQQLMAQEDFIAVTPDDWLCDGCVQAFMQQRLWIWWHREKLLGRVLNETVREDCWYGYDCRTQTHKPEHAAKLNHLCFNTNHERLAMRMAARAVQLAQATAESSG